MADTTMINIQPCHIGTADAHNRRLKHLDYVREDLSHLNQNWSGDERSLPGILDDLKRSYKATTGQRMQAKATPIREGVILIREDTTLAQLQHFARQCEERWGIRAVRISTHLDEGHTNAEGVWTPNLHAHMVFIWADEATGKSRRLGKKDLAQMQTLLSECLEMKRGVSSDRTHLDAISYKYQQTQQQVEQAQERLSAVEDMVDSVGQAAAEQQRLAATEAEALDTLVERRKEEEEAFVELEEERRRKQIEANAAAREAREKQELLSKIGAVCAEDVEQMNIVLIRSQQITDKTYKELEAKHTSSKLFGGEKTDYVGLCEDLRMKLRGEGFVGAIKVDNERREIERLKGELKKKNSELEWLKKSLEDTVVEVCKMLGDKFKGVFEDAKQYFYNTARALWGAVVMWNGQKLHNDKDGREKEEYTADRTRGRMLINGQTLQERHAQSRQRKRGLRR